MINLEEVEEIPVATKTPERKKGKSGRKPVRDINKCQRCGLCWIFCPEGAIRKTESGSYEVDYTFCTGCLICEQVCPFKAIKGVEIE